jgi:hypothetical protein
MSKYFVRVNGVGNAWPVPLGRDHPFYDPDVPEQLANASFSLIRTSGGKPVADNIEWEILIDAGHGIVQYLIKNGNRLPDATVLTHAHLDHTLSLDWIIQSYYRYHKKQKKYPLYASPPAWEFLAASFPQLPQLTDHRKLIPGQAGEIPGIPEIRLSSFPVFHGERAPGPLMLVFEINLPDADTVKILFSGDLLCPLLRKADYRFLKDSDMVFLDANNRFPYTSSNHWSICSEGPGGMKESKYLSSYRRQLSCTRLIANQLSMPADELTHAYFDEFLAYCDESIPFSVFDFCRRITPKNALLVHYSGMEDLNHNAEALLNQVQLENWANAEAERRDIRSRFIVPQSGDLIELQ